MSEGAEAEAEARPAAGAGQFFSRAGGMTNPGRWLSVASQLRRRFFAFLLAGTAEPRPSSSWGIVELLQRLRLLLLARH